MLGELLEAGVLELSCIFNTIDFLDELGPSGQDINIFGAEVIDVLIEVVSDLSLLSVSCSKSGISQGSEGSQEEVTGMETRGHDDTIY